MEEKRKAYEEKFDAKLNEWNAQIALLRTKAENARASAKIHYYKNIDDLEEKLNAAKKKLRELKAAGEEAWDGLKTGAEKAWADAKAALHDAISKFE